MISYDNKVGRISPATMRDSPHSAKLGQRIIPSAGCSHRASYTIIINKEQAALALTKLWFGSQCLPRALCCQHHELIHKLDANFKHNRRKYEERNLKSFLIDIHFRNDAAESQNMVLRIDKTTWRRSKSLHEAIHCLKTRRPCRSCSKSPSSLNKVGCK